MNPKSIAAARPRLPKHLPRSSRAATRRRRNKLKGNMKLKTTLILTTALVAVACSALFSGCSEQQIAQPAEIPSEYGFRETANNYFETGVMLGYAVAKYGGTTNDANAIIQAQKDNRPDIVEAWFHGR